eukprot:CAMPEP_0197661856 /NCGR_PEP_ID=MMETSP1338-20131121/51711_1 /TAXON_ID=43686 ORGANISM="Pelagodinium beii, Strain RCC1491" /NCGR_SAMPLE_ID=MMETSP1338 /ASSEMBLY_ACC=CAM_ASM_000754 /LENGTH=350 /DNA_ID=CAMNT_0043239497 /DNA_START=114 /DNA_END=1166 /DNA_ORIENTATION=+
MKDKVKKGCRTCGYAVGVVFLVVFICAWIVQFAVFYFATSMSGCTGSGLEDYSYPGAEASEAGPASWNLMPKISLLAEREPMWYGEAFDVIPSNEASNVASAPVGTWWQTWGPIFYTYTYEDVANSQTTMYMRRKLLRIGQCHVIERCDGKGPVVTFTEGNKFFVNRLRKFFKMNQGYSYKIYLDDEFVGVAEETQHGFQSLTFRDDKTGKSIASSVLKERHFHGQYDLWLVNNDDDDKLPYYVSSAATLLFAFHTINEDARKVVSQGVKPDQGSSSDKDHSPHFLSAESKPEEAATELDEAKVASPQVTPATATESEEAAPAVPTQEEKKEQEEDAKQAAEEKLEEQRV